MSDDRPMNRRRFFRRGLAELLKPLAQTVEQIADAAKPLTDLEKYGTYPYSPPPAPVPEQPQHWLRPPGALPEQQFADMCSRTGECVRACPAQAIQIDYMGNQGLGLPYIDAAVQACVLCDGLHCMAVCPTGALVATPKEEIDIGTAVWHQDLCLRQHGDPCQICVERCPIGASAIRVDDAGNIAVIEEGCTGCGVCEHDCPTYPKSITITPKAARPQPEPLPPD